MDKLLIVGAGIGQVPLLEKAKSKGIHTTVATIPGDYPCIKIADDVIFKDIYDRDGLVAEAKKRNITAVVSDQNDLMMPTVAYIAEKLGFCGNKFETVMSYCDKNRFRNVCQKIGVPIPKHVIVDSLDFDFSKFECPLPWIVKPSDSQSSIGVKKINNRDEINRALSTALSKSHTKTAIVEHFFQGKELVCEGLICNGKYYNLEFGDRKYFNIENLFIPCQTIFPSKINKKFLDKIIQYESKIAEYTRPSFAIVHSEYLINESTDEICVVESALRGGGEYISSDIIPLVTGIDITDWLLKSSMGINTDLEAVFEKKIHRAAGYVCFSLDEGVIQSIDGIDKLKRLPCVEKAYMDDIAYGLKTTSMTYKGARKGPIIIQGDNRNEIDNLIELVQQTLHIVVKTDDGRLEDIKWD